jgi:hypothetical protein
LHSVFDSLATLAQDQEVEDQARARTVLGSKQAYSCERFRSTQHKLQQKKAHGLGAEREKVNEFDLVSDVSKLVYDGKVKLVTKSGEYHLDKSTEQMFIASKRAKLPSGQLKWEKFRKIYPDAECETLARIIPEDAESDIPAEEFKVLKFTDRHDDVVNSFKAQFDDPTLARFKFLVIVGESRTGKTVFAENMYKNPFIMNSGWNFGKYDANVHDCIVCNDIRDIATKV